MFGVWCVVVWQANGTIAAFNRNPARQSQKAMFDVAGFDMPRLYRIWRICCAGAVGAHGANVSLGAWRKVITTELVDPEQGVFDGAGCWEGGVILM